MKSSIFTVSACSLLVVVFFRIADRAADDSGTQQADLASVQPNADQKTQASSIEPRILWNRPRKTASLATTSPEVLRVIEQMDFLVLDAIDLDAESPGVIANVNTASLRLRDELFLKFREAGGSSEELLEWLSGITARGGRNDYLLKTVIADTVLEASNTPGRAALDWLVSQPDSDFITTNLFEQSTRSWLRGDRKMALEWLDQNMDRFEGHGVRFVMADWPEDDVAGAREWVETRMDSEGSVIHPSYVSDVARMLARQDPDGAYEWMFSLDQQWHDWGLMGIMQGLPETELSRAADWLTENRDVGRELDDTRSTVANRIAESDPRTAIELAADITNFAEGDKVIITAARNLYRREPQIVQEWLPISGLTEAVQAAILSDK